LLKILFSLFASGHLFIIFEIILLAFVIVFHRHGGHSPIEQGEPPSSF